jgi:hypothetical protein
MFMDMYGVRTTRDPKLENIDQLLRESLKRAISSSKSSPAQIAEALEKRLGRPIKEGLIYAWTKTGHRWHLPADAVPTLCEILQDDTIQRQLLSPKLRQALELGESVPRVVSLLQNILGERDRDKEKPERRSKR